MKFLKSNNNFFMVLLVLPILVLKGFNIINLQVCFFSLIAVCLEQVVVDIYTILIKNSLEYEEFIKIDDMMSFYLMRTSFCSFLSMFCGIITIVYEPTTWVFLTLLSMTIVMVLTYIAWLLFFGDGLPDFRKNIPDNYLKVGTYRSGCWISDRMYGENIIYSRIKHKILLFAYIHSRYMALVYAAKTYNIASRIKVGWKIKQL